MCGFIQELYEYIQLKSAPEIKYRISHSLPLPAASIHFNFSSFLFPKQQQNNQARKKMSKRPAAQEKSLKMMRKMNFFRLDDGVKKSA